MPDDSPISISADILRFVTPAGRSALMKACTYCGGENEDAALHCRECGTEFVVEVIPDPHLPQAVKFKRPASHRWAIAIFTFMTGAFVLYLIDVVTGRPGTSPRENVLLAVIFPLCAAASFSLVAGKKRRWAYYVTAGSMAIMTGRTVYATSILAYRIFFDGAPFTKPYYHFAQQEKPFVVHEQFPMLWHVLVIVCACLMVWLFVRFTFGHPSRSYYDFPTPPEKNDATSQITD